MKNLNQDVFISLLPQIANAYGLGDLSSYDKVNKGISNINYFITTVDNCEYCVRFLINQDIKTIENDIHIANILREHNILSPKYLKSKYNTEILNTEKYNIVVSKKLRGKSDFVVNTQIAFEFGKYLAIFHKYVTKLPYIHNHALLHQSNNPVNELYKQDLPTGIIHGDFHPANALVDVKNNKISAMMDFEGASQNIFIVDLAVTILSVCGYDDSSVDVSLINSCIAGYQLIRNLTKNEILYLPQAFEYSANAWINWFRNNNYEMYALEHIAKYNDFLDKFPKIIH
jgi:Ser/Thr protein kinase RdoA (MazF antagonist)